MPEYIGPITIPEIAASGTFPAVVHFGSARISAPEVVVHQFATQDAKVEQRFYRGDGLRRVNVNCASLSQSEKAALVTFLDARKGSYQPFTLAWKENDGTSTNLTVRLESPAWAVQRIADGQWNTALTLVEEPGTAPTYDVEETLSRFPSAGLATALLEQVQEVIPLVTITVGTYTIRLSDRRVTIGGDLYQSRLLSWDGISQSLGEASDTASFTLGNADRVFTSLVNTVDLDRARIEFAAYSVATESLVNLWVGHIHDWELGTTGDFVIRARDGVSPLRQAYPRRTITRQDGFEVGAQPVSVGGKKGIARFTATSVSNDTAYGKPLKDVWVNNVTTPLPVPCDVIAGRDESEFYAALGVVGRGPISAYGTDHTLDNQPNHGPGSLGLRRAYGGNPSTGSEALTNNSPDQGSNWFALDAVGTSYPQSDAGPTGAAFLQIRRTDEKGVQALRPGERQMVASVAQGLGGWVWSGASAPYTRTWTAAVTNRAWICINTYLNALGLSQASQSAQEAVFDVASAIAAAAICAETVDKLIGEGTETQFVFTGIVGAEERTLTDWIRDILAGCLGYYTIAAGKLKIGIRINSSVVEAFTTGNIIYNSLRLSSRTPEYNHLTVGFADEEYAYQGNTLTLKDEDHITQSGQTLKANINLLGVTGKSQAARVATVAFREAMGGLRYTGAVDTDGAGVSWVSGTKFVSGMEGQPITIDGTAYTVDSVTDDENIVLTATAGTQSGATYSANYEVLAARRGSFRTTILALNIEPGMVCSLTHPEMPGGAGEFRIQSWRLNSDWSIDVEWVSTADSMYDTAIGPKPDDVSPDELPERPYYDIDTPGTTGGNILRNPGFERGIVGWHGLDIPAAGWEIVATGQDTGRRALKISYAGACEIHQPLDFEDDGYDTMPCAEGQTYRFAGRYKFAAASTASSAQARIAFYQSDGTYIDAGTADLDPADTDWTDFALTATAPALAKYMGIFPWFGTLTAGAVYLDTLEAALATDPEAPGHVTDLTIALDSSDRLRGRLMNVYQLGGNAPPTAEFRGFNAVRIYYVIGEGEYLDLGSQPISGATAGAAWQVYFRHDAPDAAVLSQTFIVQAENSHSSAPFDTAPNINLNADGEASTPSEPSNVLQSIVGNAQNEYGIKLDWAKPSPQNGVVGYHFRSVTYEDDGGLTEDETIDHAGIQGYDVVAAWSQYRTLPTPGTRWIKSGVRSFNAFGETSIWVWSDLAPLEVDPATVVPQPGVDDWALGTVIYAVDANGVRKVGLPINVIALRTGCDYVTAFLQISGVYTDVGFNTATLGEQTIWLDWPEEATDFPCKLVGQKYSAVRIYGSDNDVKTFEVLAWSKPLPLTSFEIEDIEYENYQGQGSTLYRAKYTVVGPTDPMRFGVALFRRWTDDEFEPVAGDDGEWNRISGSPKMIGVDTITWYSSDEPSYGAPKDGIEWSQTAAVAVDHAGNYDFSDAIIYNVTRLADGGFKAYAIDPDTVLGGLHHSAAGLSNTSRDLKNSDFEFGLKDWTYTAGWSAVTVDAYLGTAAQCTANGADQDLAQYFACSPGQQHRVQCYARENTDSVGYIQILYYKSDLTYISGVTGDAAISGDTYTTYAALGTAPALAAMAQVRIYVPSTATTGRLIVDQFTMSVVEPLATGLTRDGDGVSNTSRDLKNADFEFGLADWSYSAQWSADTAEAYKGTAAKCTANGADQYICQDLPIAPGQPIRFEAWAKESCNSTASIQIIWYTAAGSVISTLSTTITGDTYALYAVTGTAPSTAATARLNVAVPAANTSGRVMVDQARMVVLEPTNTTLITRTASGIALLPIQDYISDWGFGTNDFDKADGKLIVKTALISKLLTQTIVLTGEMYVLDSTSTNGVRVNASGVLVGNSSQYVDIQSSGISIKGGGQENKLTSSGMEILIGGSSKVLITSSTMSVATGLQVNSGSTIYFEVLASVIDCRVNTKFHAGFEYVAGGVTIPSGSRSDWRTAIGLTTATLNYKDHSGTDQTMTVVVLA